MTVTSVQRRPGVRVEDAGIAARVVLDLLRGLDPARRAAARR